MAAGSPDEVINWVVALPTLNASHFSMIFPNFSIYIIILKAFQDLANFYLKLQDFPDFPGSVYNPVQQPQSTSDSHQ